MFESVAPTSAEDQYARRVSWLEARIGELERSGGRFDGGAGPPTGTGLAGQRYYDRTNNRLWRSTGSAWVFERAYDSTKRPGVVLTSASQAVGAGATVTVSWTTEVSDVDGWITAPGTTLIVPAGWAGCYQATFRVQWSASTASPMESSLLVNGALSLNAAGGAANAYRSLSGAMRGLVATDTVACSAFNGSAGSLNMTCVLVIDWLYR